MTEWRTERLKHLASVSVSNVDKLSVDGEVPISLANYTDVYYNDAITADLPLMQSTATPEQVQRFTLRAGDTLITKDSETADDIAVPAFVPADLPNVVCGYHLAVIRPRADVDGKYLYWCLASSALRDRFAVRATGVTRFGLRSDAIGNAAISVPEAQEQRAIADFLDAETARIDALVACRQRMTELAHERRLALAGDLVRAAGTPGPRRASGVDPLGEVPRHWSSVRNKDVLREVTDLTQIGEEELLTISHLTGVTRRSEKDVTMFMAESLGGYKRCELGDLVINTMWAWMGALGVAREPGIVSPAYGVYRFNPQIADPHYFELLYRSRAYVCEMTRHSKGVWSSRLRLYPEAFLALNVPLPPLDEQRAIVDQYWVETRQVDTLLQLEQRAVSLLKERRQALITAAVTGEIDVTKGTA